MLIAVGVDILSQKGDLLKAPCLQVVYLSQNTVNITTALPSTGIRNDTVMTEVVTATHDTHIAADFHGMETLRDNILVGLGG